MTWNLADAGPGYGGFCCIPGSHKSHYQLRQSIATSGAALNATHGVLGKTQNATIKTLYSASVDQGLDLGDGVTVSPNRVDFAFDVWNVVDQLRIITLAN